MKKIININFHSRVVPIEESAYEILQQYVDSLRKYFANEEGRDEIISDIENRFSELFAETLKKGATCITDDDVNTIIASMGRPEDFEQEDIASGGASANANTTNSTTDQKQDYQYTEGGGQTTEPRRLYRSENDKILGGVCGGLANYLKIDPAIVRILFALLIFAGGASFLIYIVLWVILPYKALPSNVRKRLYRNPDDRVIGGVASGLAAYFHIEVWIPRLIFALPLILSIIASIFRSAWFDYDGPVFFTGGFGGTLFITYIVLWIVLPEAVTASEKLEMRGEKVDLESIKNTIKSDLESFKGKAKEMGTEMQERFSQVGKDMRKGTQQFSSEVAPGIRRTTNGFGHAVGVLFKAFFLFIAGVIVFALIMVLVGLVFRGAGVLTVKDFILVGFWQNFLAWATFFLFLVIPVIALLTWLIRRITGVRSRNHYLGYSFATLWVIGLFCGLALVGMVIKDFRTRQHVEEDFKMTQPQKGKLLIKAAATDMKSRYYEDDWWFDADWHRNGIFSSITADSLMLNTIRISLLKSVDSAYHIQIIKFSHGNNPEIARNLAQQVVFQITQEDSVLYLPDGFAISRNQKFRNQQVLVAVAIPVGKKIMMNNNIERYHYFNLDMNNHHIHWSNHWNNGDDEDYNDNMEWARGYSWKYNVEYIMTPNGLVRTHKEIAAKDEDGNNDSGDDDNSDDDDDNSKDSHTHHSGSSAAPAPATPAPSAPVTPDNGGYRYHRSTEPAKPKADSVSKNKQTAMLGSESHFYLLSTLFL